MHPSREPSKRGEILPMFVEILLIYAAANIELRNCEIFTQSRRKFDFFIHSYIL